MLGDESISPRAAIRSWLLNAEDRPRRSDKSESLKQPERSGRSRRDSTKPGTGEPRRSRRPATEQYSPRQGRHEFEELGLKHDVTGTGRVPKQQILLRPKGLNLAERLGLHAPFRTFRDHSDDGEVDLDALSRPQKRRRRASSSSSYLEAAEIDDAGEHDRGADHYTRIPESRRKARKHTRSSARSSSEALPETLPPPANHTTSYERRSRHKTREDHYDLKKPDDAREKRRSTKKEGAEKRHKPRKRKEKSGAALVHDFAAQNVAQDRLTLQPSKPLGFFGKGRASSPVRRRGLPDLAFSEMTFLNPRRARPEEEAKVSSNRPSDKAKRRKSSKAADTEAEISRYFTSAKMTDQNATKRQPQQKKRDSHGKIRTHDSPPAFIDLPNTPFLGFGSSGGNSVSPVKKLSSPALKDLERRLTRSVTRSTSYLTWSESGTPSQGSLDSKRRRIIPLNSSRLSNCNARSPAPHKARLSNAPNSSPCAPKAPLEKPDRISSTAPKDQITHTARHSQDCYPQAGVKRTSDTTVPEEHQGPGKTRIDKRDDPQYASKDAVPLIQIPRSPDQHHDDSGFLREDAKFSHANQSQNRATTPVQTPNLRGRETVSPLEDTLEALLQECRARRKIGAVPPSVDQSRSNTLRNNENMPHRQSDHISPRSENPCRNAPAPASRSQVSVPPRVDRGNEYAKFALRDHRPESSRHGTVSSQQTRSTPLSNIPFLSESSRGNSRSAWTGYENMYERQQDLDQPTIPNERDYEVDQLRTNSADYDEIPINPSVFDYHNQEQRYRIDDGGGTGEYARDEELGHWPTNEMPAETEALNCQDGWHDVEADLFAEYEQETPFQNNKSGQQNHELFREPQQHSGRLEGADESDYPYVQDGPSANRLWHDNASYPPENSGHGNRNANVSMQDSTEDPALSTFWTPHRLY